MSGLTSQAMIIAATAMLTVGTTNSEAISKFTTQSLSVASCVMSADNEQQASECKNITINIVCDLGMTAADMNRLYAEGRTEEQIMTEYGQGLTSCSIVESE